MPCSACQGNVRVKDPDRDPAALPLFRLTRDLNKGDFVEVTLRSGYAGHGVIRRIYISSGVESVDCFMDRSQSMVTATPARGDLVVKVTDRTPAA